MNIELFEALRTIYSKSKESCQQEFDHDLYVAISVVGQWLEAVRKENGWPEARPKSQNP